MKLSNTELRWVQKNEPIIKSILNKRIEDLLNQLLDIPEEKRDVFIAFIKEYRIGLGLLKEANKEQPEQDITGV